MRLGIENEPEEWQVENLRDISENVFQKIRDYFGVPVAVSSGFRSPELNEAIGGSTKSQHCKGFALDLDADVFGRITNAEIFQFVKDNLEFDQMIWEFGTDEEPDWVHISYVCNENIYVSLCHISSIHLIFFGSVVYSEEL